jgi:hypothetical protein
MGHSTVMLSTFAPLSVNSAKHLFAQRDRPFAALRVTVEGPISSAAIDAFSPTYFIKNNPANTPLVYCLCPLLHVHSS